MNNLQQDLRDGVVYRQKRHSGDTHADLGGSINESKTDALMAKAADEVERLQGVIKSVDVELLGWEQCDSDDMHAVLADIRIVLDEAEDTEPITEQTS